MSLAHESSAQDLYGGQGFEIAEIKAGWPIIEALRRQPLGAVGFLLLLVFFFCALFAPWLAPQDPAQLDLTGRLMGPSAAHWFGTDELGRDILSRTLYGARISLVVSVSVVGLSLALGLVAGGLAGFYGGWTDTVVNVYVSNAFLALPGILLAIAFVAFMGPGLVNVILALAINLAAGLFQNFGLHHLLNFVDVDDHFVACRMDLHTTSFWVER